MHHAFKVSFNRGHDTVSRRCIVEHVQANTLLSINNFPPADECRSQACFIFRKSSTTRCFISADTILCQAHELNSERSSGRSLKFGPAVREVQLIERSSEFNVRVFFLIQNLGGITKQHTFIRMNIIIQFK
jgi:hypothetical protein